ncbi:MAG: ATP-binding cassette domain-containing protein [Oligoflexus sp.]
MIVAESLQKSFKQIHAVRGISLEARDGKITGLLGENGAGKTTTIRILSGSIKADQGRILIDGQDLAHSTYAIKRRLGILSDKGGLYQRLTARENIQVFAQLMGLQGAELDRAVEHVIKLLDIHDIADRPIGGFSTGQRVKVALARILVYRPQNILLDEPTSGLDVLAKRNLRMLIRRLRDEGYCILFSSHIMEEVEQLCDQVYVVHEGLSVGSGSVQDLMIDDGAQRFEDVFVKMISGGAHV